jgi:HK97 family phage major capsid protein
LIGVELAGIARPQANSLDTAEKTAVSDVFAFVGRARIMTTDPREDLCKRRDAVLAKARALVEPARAAGRDLTDAEAVDVDALIAEAKSINQMLAADDRHRGIMASLDAQAASALRGLPGDGRRLAFGKSMVSDAASKIMPPGGQKALAVSGTTVVSQQFVADPVKLGQPPTSLLSVLPVQVQTSPQFAWLKQSVRNNQAGIVSEGSAKPTSVYTVVRVEDKLDVIAHLSEPVPRYWFADEPALQAFLNNELAYGLALAVEHMALADIAGTSGIQSNSYSTSLLATLLRSLTLLESNGYPPGTFVMHPSDFELIQGALLSTAAVEYQGLPFDPVARRLWGVPITVTNAQTGGVAHTLASGSVGLNTDSQGVQIAWSETSNADDWSKNLIRARCEGRYATSVFQPLGVVQSNLTA